MAGASSGPVMRCWLWQRCACSRSALARGRELLAEAEKVTPRIRGTADSEVFASNLALLRLAVGLPDLALYTLTPLQTINLKDTVAAYTAVALARLGRVAESLAGLKAAEESFGLTDVLRAAGEHIRNGTAFSSIATVASRCAAPSRSISPTTA